MNWNSFLGGKKLSTQNISSSRSYQLLYFYIQRPNTISSCKWHIFYGEWPRWKHGTKHQRELKYRIVLLPCLSGFENLSEHHILVPQVIFKIGFLLYYLLIIQADTWGEKLFKSNAIYPFWCWVSTCVAAASAVLETQLVRYSTVVLAVSTESVQHVP